MFILSIQNGVCKGGGLMEAKKILAMDLSLNLPAFAIVGIRDGVPEIIDVCHVNNKKHTNWTQAQKLKATADMLRNLLWEHSDVDVVVRERGFSRFAQTTQALFRVVGISDLVAFEEFNVTQVEEIPPTTIKSIVGGYGKATKEEVEEGLRKMLPEYQKDYVFATDDESDAVAVAVTYAYKKGWLK